MLKILRTLAIFLFLCLSTAACEIYRVPDTVIQEVTPTPVPRVKSIGILDVQAGNTNFIVIVGILIFLFIAIPIILHYKDWRSS